MRGKLILVEHLTWYLGLSGVLERRKFKLLSLKT